MKLLSLTFRDKTSNWAIEKIDFNEVTLLVGASGVGKTKILKALLSLRNLTLGRSMNKDSLCISWELKFIEDKFIYTWSGETERSEYDSLYNEEDRAEGSVFINEKLIIQTKTDTPKVIFHREKNEVVFDDDKAPKVTSTQSCINIFSDEELIKPIKKGFKKMFFFNFEQEKMRRITEIKMVHEGDFNEALAFDKMREINNPLLGKLAIAYEYFPRVFEQIKNQYMDVFHFVEDIRFQKSTITIENKELLILDLQIKEEGCDWISYIEMSSGMLKTLLYIGLINLVPDSSIILIDEFENSLGVNCIDLHLDTNFAENTQFILTSHHPYIINSMPMETWKIISRHAGNVIARNASDYNLGKSKHEAFKQLMNIEAYLEGR
ncbi:MULTISPECIES: ATP-binding protein [Brevibacillus]|uniref:ATP-binding protein n=1 Tax=Brevibacillus TaxID=55080 RepID=UPI000ECDF8F3|nr:ATP-binding protein [Brevibacillus sp.]HBZ80021.1 hypothetical protein [Brevibacillus sp.]